MKKKFLRVLIFTTEHPVKVLRILDALRSKTISNVEIFIITNQELNPPFEYSEINILVIKEPSIYHLRCHIPELAKGTEWVLLLEDHNLISSEYLGKVNEAICEVQDETKLIYGPTENLTTKNKWSWPNYLFVQVKHWDPVMNIPNEPIIFNGIYRSKEFPSENYRVGEFETRALNYFFSRATFNPTFKVDHVQYRRFPSVLYYYFCHGRATSGTYSPEYKDRAEWTKKHLERLFKVRWKESLAIIKRHPKASQLPRFTITRLFILYLTDALGLIFGAVWGAGKSAEALE